jgi:hypothetical protein
MNRTLPPATGTAHRMTDLQLQSELAEQPERSARTIRIFGRDFPMPRSRPARVLIGVGLMILGMFGFLPVLGFWMLPLGLLVLSYEFAAVRRKRRRLQIWWERRRRRQAAS